MRRSPGDCWPGFLMFLPRPFDGGSIASNSSDSSGRALSPPRDKDVILNFGPSLHKLITQNNRAVALYLEVPSRDWLELNVA